MLSFKGDDGDETRAYKEDVVARVLTALSKRKGNLTVVTPAQQTAFWLYVAPCFQRESFGMLNRLQSEIYIQIRPVEVLWCWLFYINDLANRRIPEPWKILVRHKQFSVTYEDPYPMPGDIRACSH